MSDLINSLALFGILLALVAVCMTLSDIRNTLRKSNNLLWTAVSGGDADPKDAA